MMVHLSLTYPKFSTLIRGISQSPSYLALDRNLKPFTASCPDGINQTPERYSCWSFAGSHPSIPGVNETGYSSIPMEESKHRLRKEAFLLQLTTVQFIWHRCSVISCEHNPDRCSENGDPLTPNWSSPLMTWGGNWRRNTNQCYPLRLRERVWQGFSPSTSQSQTLQHSWEDTQLDLWFSSLQNSACPSWWPEELGDQRYIRCAPGQSWSLSMISWSACHLQLKDCLLTKVYCTARFHLEQTLSSCRKSLMHFNWERRWLMRFNSV